MKKLISVSLIAILVAGCGKSAVTQLSEPEPLYNMTPLDSNSDADIKDVRDVFFSNVIITVAVGTFAINIFRNVPLAEVVVTVFLGTASALSLSSYVYVYLFPKDTSFKNSDWYKHISLMVLVLRAFISGTSYF